MGIEDPAEDVAEQHTPVVVGSDDEGEFDGDTTLVEPPWEADPADVAEQLWVVPIDAPPETAEWVAEQPEPDPVRRRS
jgi:hypothetical protein